MHKRRGDTLIEVTLAVGIFSMVAIAAVAVLSGGTSSAQTALETTLAREEIDAQSEAIRFIQSAALAEEDTNGPYSALWQAITDTKYTTSSYEGPNNNQSCSSMYADGNEIYRDGKAFVINTHALGRYAESYNKDGKAAINQVLIRSNNSNNIKFKQTQTYPHLIYGNSASDNADTGNLADNNLGLTNLYSVAGIYVVAVPDQGTSTIVGDSNAKGFDDFYVQTCWYGSGSDTASTISTVIRLYNPQADIAQGASTYKIYYSGNGDADAYSGGTDTKTYDMKDTSYEVDVLENNFTKLCYDSITAYDIWGGSAPKTPIWTTEPYYDDWKSGFSFNANGENLFGNEYGYDNNGEDGGRLAAMKEANKYLEKKDNDYIAYLKDKLGDTYVEAGVPGKYYVAGNGNKIMIPSSNSGGHFTTLYAQWHKDYNHSVCSPLYVSYTVTGKSPEVSSDGVEDPSEDIGATQGFIVPDERAWNEEKKIPAVAAVRGREHYTITRDKLKFPISTCRTSDNDWQFISDDSHRGENPIHLDVLVPGGIDIKNITDFNLIATAKFNSGNLFIKKKNLGNDPEPLTVFFNIACLAPSMQADVDLEYCIANAQKELQVRDERDNELYYVVFRGDGGFSNAVATTDGHFTITYGAILEYQKSNFSWMFGLDVGGYTTTKVDGKDFVYNPKKSSCIMTQNLRFEGSKSGEEDIAYVEKEMIDKKTGDTIKINVGSNVKKGFSKKLTETTPVYNEKENAVVADGGEEDDESNVKPDWAFGNGEARYVSYKNLDKEPFSGEFFTTYEDRPTYWYSVGFSKSGGAVDGYNGQKIEGSNETKKQKVLDWAKADTGTWYNYYAAHPDAKIENDGEGDKMTVGDDDICPAGWHMLTTEEAKDIIGYHEGNNKVSNPKGGVLGIHHVWQWWREGKREFDNGYTFIGAASLNALGLPLGGDGMHNQYCTLGSLTGSDSYMGCGVAWWLKDGTILKSNGITGSNVDGSHFPSFLDCRNGCFTNPGYSIDFTPYLIPIENGEYVTTNATYTHVRCVRSKS